MIDISSSTGGFVENKIGKKYLLCGSVNGMVCGESVYNKLVKSYLEKNNAQVRVVCTDITNESIGVSAGGLSFEKVIRALVNIIKAMFILPTVSVLYATPGLTRFGFIRFAPVILFAILLRKRVVLHYHGARLGKLARDPFLGYFVRWVMIKVNANIFLSHSLMDDAVISAKERDNFYVVPNCISDEYFVESLKRGENESLKLLYLGNLLPEKGVFDAIDVARNLNLDNIDYSLKIIGKGAAEVELEVINTIAPLSNVEFLGPIYGEDKISLIRSCNILLFPSTYDQEAFPLVILECMAAGCSIISYDIGGVRDMLDGTGDIVESTSSAMTLAVKNMKDDGEMFFSKRCGCLKKASVYSYEHTMNTLSKVICG